MTRRTAAGLALLIAGAAVAYADLTPAGPEFQVNTFTPYSEARPAIASTADGRFVIVWESQGYFYAWQDGSRSGVFGQRYDATGAPAGAEFQVNTYTTGPQFDPAVAADAAGQFTVSWTSGYSSYYSPSRYPSQDGSTFGAFLQTFDAARGPAGSEMQANAFTTGEQSHTAVARSAGQFVVVWQSDDYFNSVTQDGSSTGIFARRYDDAGVPADAEFQVNSYTTDAQSNPAVASDGAGGFVVVWESGGYYGSQDGSYDGVFGQRFSVAGTPLGTEFQVNTYTTGVQAFPAIAAGPAGTFVVVWQSGSYYYGAQDGSRSGIFGQRYDAAGLPIGAEFQVNTYTTGFQQEPNVAVDPAGNFVVVWSQPYSYFTGVDHGLFAQAFGSDGSPNGPQFQVDTYTTGYAQNPVVGAGPTGEFIVAWTGPSGQDGSQLGVFARRFRIAGALRALSGASLRLKAPSTDPARKRLAVHSTDPAITLGHGNGSVDDPTLTGGRLEVRSLLFDDTYNLPAPNWRTIGSAGANQGYAYRDRRLAAGPVSSVKVSASGQIRIAAKGAQLGHTLGANPDPVTIVLQTGNLGHRYCMTFGGTTRFVPGTLFRATGAPAACGP